MKMAHTPTTENLTRLRKPTTLVLDPRLENSAALQFFLWQIAVLWGNMHMSFFSTNPRGVRCWKGLGSERHL